MVRVVWTELAIDDKFHILRYWDRRNKSKKYSIKLNRLLKEAAIVICKYPFMGKTTEVPNIRIKIVKDYFLVYEIVKNKIIILRIWDTRRNPNQLM